VQPNRVTILADTAVRAHDLDEAAAIAAKQRAEEALAGKIDKLEQAEALAELSRIAAQLKILEKMRKGRG
jgi:F-type H+-transporting ATPase subunit epsilon